MKFNETKARELIEKYQFSESSLRTWKERGSIPDYLARPIIQRLTEKQEKEVLDFLSLEWITPATFLQLCDLSKSTFYAYRRNRHYPEWWFMGQAHPFVVEAKKELRQVTAQSLQTFLQENKWLSPKNLALAARIEPLKFQDWARGKKSITQPEKVTYFIRNNVPK